MRPWQIAVVGGGPGGLFTAYTLQGEACHPYRLTLFEASDRLGGKILTPAFARAGATYEAGAAEFYDYSHLDDDPLRELVEDDLGLPLQHMEGASAVVDGRPVANLDDLAALWGPAAAEAVRAFDRRARDLITPHEFATADEDAVGDPLVRPGFDAELAAIAHPAARRYVERFIHSDLATEPARTSVLYGLHNYLMNDPAYMNLYGISGGNERLPRELAKRIAADVRFDTPVRTVGRSGDGRLRVGTDAGEAVFDAVVLALPHDALGRVNFDGDDLAAAMARHLAQYHHPAHYLRVSVAFERNFWAGKLVGSYAMLEAFGGCCLYDEGSRNPGRPTPVLGWLIAGDAAVALNDRTDDELVAAALGSLPMFLADGRSLVVEAKVHRWIGAVNALPGGLRPPHLDRRHRPEPRRHPHLFAVGDYLFDSTLNGVLESADYVARWVAALLADRPGASA